jgi:hypothetical protein
MPEPRRFPPPWTVEEYNDACFIVTDSGQKLAYVYFEDEPGRRSAAKLLSKDEARRIASNIAKLPELTRQVTVTRPVSQVAAFPIPRHPWPLSHRSLVRRRSVETQRGRTAKYRSQAKPSEPTLSESEDDIPRPPADIPDVKVTASSRLQCPLILSESTCTVRSSCVSLPAASNGTSIVGLTPTPSGR